MYREVVTRSAVTMKLSNFEEYFEDIILERGFAYYSNHRITAIKKIAEGHFVAEVEGSEHYTVEAVLGRGEEILRLSCDCPYVDGPFCKHQAAVLYALRNEEKKPGAEKNGGAGINSGRRQDIATLLSSLAKEELINIVRKHLQQYPELEQQLLFEYAAVEQETTAAKKLIKYHIRKATHRGFIDWDKASEAMEGAWQVLAKADRHLKEGNPVKAVKLALTVLSSVVEVLAYCDDSSGSVGTVIGVGIKTINASAQVIAEKSTPAEQEQIFQMIFGEALAPRYDDWLDWRWDLLQACTALCTSAARREKLERVLEAALDKITKKRYPSSHEIQRIKLLQLAIIERCDSRQKAEAFIKENIGYSEFREKAVVAALREGRYETAISLCLEGEEADHDRPGLRNKWREYRYLAYEKAGDLENQRQLALRFVLIGHFEYYRKLKKLYEPHEWPPVVDSIIAHFQKMPYTPAVYSKILIEERLTERLLEYCRSNVSEIEDLYPHLIDEYRHEVEQLFAAHIREEAARSGSRLHYRQVCSSIRRYKKLFGEEKAAQIVLELKNRYRRRPAFIDEISRI